MFKRVERKRKRQEEEEELGLDEDTKEIMGLNDTSSDESDDSDGGDSIREDSDQEEDAASGDEPVDEEEPISVAEALKDPIYLISLDPTIYGCVLCKGKLIKNAGMAAVHKNADAHRRRFEHFRELSVGVDPRSNAWKLVRSAISVSMQSTESQNLSKRALKRQVKQAALREKRKHHKDLKTKAMAKKALKKLSTADKIKNNVPSSVDSKDLPVSKIHPQKRQKQDGRTLTTKSTEDAPDPTLSASRIRISNDSRKLASKPRHKDSKKGNRSR